MALVTRADVVRFAKITTALTEAQTATIDEFIEAATPVIEGITGPVEFATRTYDFARHRKGSIVLPIRFNAIQSLTVSGAEVDPSSYSLARADYGIIDFADGYGYWDWGQPVTVTVSVGDVTIAPNVQLAALELIAYWWQSTQQSQRTAWNEGGVPMGFAIPARVRELLNTTRGLPGIG